MIRTVAFAVVSAFFIFVSRKSLVRPRSHGFYRFFAWECILALVLLNLPYWTKDPFSPLQVISGLFLFSSLFLVAQGVVLLKFIGKPDQNRADAELLAFEKTSRLVTVGVYRYIRHPLISSLLFLAWGVFLKHPTPLGLPLPLAATLLLLVTARKEESECLQYFGAEYQAYMRGTKRFVPFLF